MAGRGQPCLWDISTIASKGQQDGRQARGLGRGLGVGAQRGDNQLRDVTVLVELLGPGAAGKESEG